MLLEEHGGIWLDADTIILKEDALKYFELDGEQETMFFGVPDRKAVHLAAIYSKPHARNMKLWIEYIRDRVQKSKSSRKKIWDYLGNSFIDVYLKAFPNEIKMTDCTEVMPERCMMQEYMMRGYSYPTIQCYGDFYFFQKLHLSDIDSSMLLLHNSWTPPVFKKMSREDFMRCNCTLANILREALDIESSVSEKTLTFHKRHRNIWTRICRRYLWDKYAILV